MNILKYLSNFIRMILGKNNQVKKLETPKEVYKKEFNNELKISNSYIKPKIETLICEGDGLGIKKGIRS